jgi:hypothetical protein
MTVKNKIVGGAFSFGVIGQMALGVRSVHQTL